MAFAEINRAIRSGDMDALKQMVQGVDDVDKLVSYGGTPFHIAARCGQTAACRVLLAAGAGVDHCGLTGRSALHLACGEGHLDTVRFLVTEAGANVVIRTFEGWSPFSCAARGGHPAVMAFLTTHGAVHLEATGGDRGLFRSALTAAANGGQLAMVRRLIAEGADKDDGGASYTPLAEAARSGYLDVVLCLADVYGADVNSRGGASGLTPLIAAAYGGHDDVVAALLRLGADPSFVDPTHGTALHVAAGAAHAAVMRCLLGAGPGGGVDVNVLDRHHRTPLHVAARKVSTARIVPVCLTGLMSSFPQCPRFTCDGPPRACELEYAVAMKLLLEQGASLVAEDADGCTPGGSTADEGVRAMLAQERAFGEEMENKEVQAAAEAEEVADKEEGGEDEGATSRGAVRRRSERVAKRGLDTATDNRKKRGRTTATVFIDLTNK